MLTEILLKANSVLANLTPEQINAITTLSQNDEGEVIGVKLREVHDKYDADIASIYGTPRGGSEKTYDYLKRALTELKTNAGSAKTLQSELATLKQQKADLEKQISEGKGNEAMQAKIAELERKLNDKDAAIADWGKKHKADVEAANALLQAEVKKNIEFRIGAAFDTAIAGMKFMDEKTLPIVARDATIAAAKKTILAENDTEFIDDGNGGERLVFRSKTDQKIQNNPENKLNPYTAAEFLTKQLQPILHVDRKQNGSGTKPTGMVSQNGTFSINGAKTQLEAHEEIGSHLVGMGISRGSEEFDTQMRKISDDNKVAELPIK